MKLLKILDLMGHLRGLAMWVVWNVPCGALAPRLMAFALNCKMKKVEEKDRG